MHVAPIDAMERYRDSDPESENVSIQARETVLKGDLSLPDGATGLVLFAHGSGSSRLSPRNRAVARELQRARLATLLIDLLTEPEEREDVVTSLLRFDIEFLALRLGMATGWTQQDRRVCELPLGLFGSSTGAAAALLAASEDETRIAAVVSRGGRPDLAGQALSRVRAPTLLIVGGDDTEVLMLNRQALHKIGASERELHVIAGATHLFEEPGAMESVARLAVNWFKTRLSPNRIASKQA